MNARISALVGALTLGLGLSVSPVASAVYLVSVDFDGNDCTGVLGGGKDGYCDVGFALPTPDNVSISPLIYKYDEEEEFGPFETISGDEFKVNGLALSKDSLGDDNKTGTWTYTPNDIDNLDTPDVDEGDPFVKYWVAKGGNEFTLYWYISDAAALTAFDEGGACYSGNYTLSCLKLAVATNTGTWDISQGLSHLSWYDTKDGGGGQTDLPEPGVLFLMGAGLLGLGMARRRKAA